MDTTIDNLMKRVLWHAQAVKAQPIECLMEHKETIQKASKELGDTLMELGAINYSAEMRSRGRACGKRL